MVFERQTVLAVCSCGTTFYYTEEGVDRMNYHINENNYRVHQWICVPDLILTEERGRLKLKEVG